METVISRDGTPIAFECSGSGPPLVLVHGTLGSHVRWAPIMPALAAAFQVYAIDRRGRGESGDADCYAVEREYEDIAAVVDSLDGPVRLLGHSFGGICALEAALLTDNVGKLILYEPPLALTGSPLENDDILSRLTALLASGDRAGVVTAFLREVVRMLEHELELYMASPAWPARIEAAHTLPREHQAVSEYRFVAERFAELSVPTLLLVGGDSPSFFRDAVQLADEALPNSQIAVLAGQQHIAMDTAPDLFVGEVLTFLRG